MVSPLNPLPSILEAGPNGDFVSCSATSRIKPCDKFRIGTYIVCVCLDGPVLLLSG
jgi:hypothetical protein